MWSCHTRQQTEYQSHRYQALLNTDKILVLHEGEQVGYDHHEKLIVENKYFYDMFAGQKEVTV